MRFLLPHMFMRNIFLVIFFCLSYSSFIVDAIKCTLETAKDVCPHSYPCCFKYGHCGNTEEHCTIKSGCIFGCWDSTLTTVSLNTPAKKEITTDFASPQAKAFSADDKRSLDVKPKPKNNDKKGSVSSKKIFYGCSIPQAISLTFDDGPSSFTDGILDILRDYGVKGTFFVIGSNINTSSSRATIKRIVAEGHVLGSHTWSHPDLTTIPDEEIIDEMKKTSDMIFASAGTICFPTRRCPPKVYETPIWLNQRACAKHSAEAVELHHHLVELGFK